MSKQGKEVFSNGTEYMAFNEAFCCRCSKYKLDGGGMPLPDNCKIEEAIAEAQFVEDKFPNDKLIPNGLLSHFTCIEFQTDDSELMEAYKHHVDGLVYGRKPKRGDGK